MSTSPWSALTVAIRNLSARVDASPTVREATLTGPTTVRFDIDSVDTVVHGNLVGAAAAGSRVLTLTLRHYIWVIGVRGGPVPMQGTIYRTSDQSMTSSASAFTDVSWQAVEELRGLSWSSSGFLIPPGGGGRYLILNRLSIQANNSGYRYWNVLKNGVAVANSSQPGAMIPSGGSAHSSSVWGSEMLDLVAGDLITLRVRQNSGSTLALNSANLTLTRLYPL